jgi:hypothetical protein
VDADYNHNGHIAMMEAFNYAAGHDYYDEVPQYDDNGDGVGHPYPIPQGGDGSLGAVTYLESWHGLTLMPLADMKFGDPGTAVIYTLQVTNTGNITDTFDTSVSSNTWPTTAPPSVQLSAGDSTDVDVIVNIPSSASGGEADIVTITFISQGDCTKRAMAVLTTTAKYRHLFLPLIVKLSAGQ